MCQKTDTFTDKVTPVPEGHVLYFPSGLYYRQCPPPDTGLCIVRPAALAHMPVHDALQGNGG